MLVLATPSHPGVSTAEPVDVLEALVVHRDQAGVAEVPGFCPQRIPEGDRAFRVGKSSLLSIPTWQLFPGESEQEGWGGGHPGSVKSPWLPNLLLLPLPTQMDIFLRSFLCCSPCGPCQPISLSFSLFIMRRVSGSWGWHLGQLWVSLVTPSGPSPSKSTSWMAGEYGGREKGALWESLC